MTMRNPMFAAFTTTALTLAGCGGDTTVPPAAPPEPAAAVTPAAPAAATEPLEATPGTAVQAFNVPSIHCEGCADTIRHQVAKLEGVDAVSVSVPAHTVWVRVKELGPQPDAVAKTITDAGYDATPADAG